jgi:UDP-2-acetamido-2,6-beta-L-arabino-hexul-4-ose reductase
MIKVLITGGRGFLGRNLAAHLAERKDCQTRLFAKQDSPELLNQLLSEADVLYHLAGVNRPVDPKEFEAANVQLTYQICQALRTSGRTPAIVFSSSTQAALDNAYGASKRRAEDVLRQFAAQTGARVRIFRLKNLFGKWCRPNYNSVTATVCHNIARDLPVILSDPGREVELSYVDDVVAAFVKELGCAAAVEEVPDDIPSRRIMLGALAGMIQTFRDMRETAIIPDLVDNFNRALYATYLSYVPDAAWEHTLEIKSDDRGSLAEFVKQTHFGQIFLSRTRPGVTRGNHYHHTKTEKFLVVDGDALIRMRAIFGGPVQEYRVRGTEYKVIDIPPGLTHSITNVGDREMVTLFWSSEIFDPDRPDTYFLPVDFEERVNQATDRMYA